MPARQIWRADRGATGGRRQLVDDDRRLVTEFLRRRDDATFRVLYRRHTPALFSLALRLVGGNSADAEDVIQNAWLRSMKSIDAFEWRSAFRTWLSGFVVNCAREVVRRRGPTVEIVGTDQRSTQTMRPDAAIDIARAIASLPEGYRTVIVLHDVEGFAHAEIGEMLGIDIGTSKSQLFNARRAMRTLIGGGRHEDSRR